MKKEISANEIIKKYNLVILLIIFIVISTILSPNFLTVDNFLIYYNRRPFRALLRSE